MKELHLSHPIHALFSFMWFLLSLLICIGGILFRVGLLREVLLKIAYRKASPILWNLLFPSILITGCLSSYAETGRFSISVWMENAYIATKVLAFSIIIFLSAVGEFLKRKSTLPAPPVWVGILNSVVGVLTVYFSISHKGG